MTNEEPDYTREYSEEKFSEKLRKYALKAGSEVLEKALFMYEALQDDETPKWAKATIIASLGYFISPLDGIPDLTPVVGFADDLGALTIAFATVAVHIKDRHKHKARETLKRWFG
jgi:uncharacterized membrane protein YkvA (DUF1232 family)